MFESLSEKLSRTFKKLRGQGKLTEKNIQEALKEVRMALLEADVNYKVVKKFVEDIRQSAMGQEVLDSLTPGQQVIKIVYEELIRLMGGSRQELNLTGRTPFHLDACGASGVRENDNRRQAGAPPQEKGQEPLSRACRHLPACGDRTAARSWGANWEFPSTTRRRTGSPRILARRPWPRAGAVGADILIMDTAGRLHIDDELMAELVRIKERVSPTEILLVADAMTGQDAVNVAKHFNDLLDISGVILTKMEGDARGGAALSVKAVTDKPIKFIGVGEKLDALEPFFPDRLASRILGMGDMLSLIEKAQEEFDEKEALKLAKKLKKREFDLEDFLGQLRQLKKLGSLEQIMSMIPGMGQLKQLKNMKPDEKELVRVEAIINSMTKEERENYKIINGSRRRRIALGSGTTIQDVNRLLKNFAQTKKMMENLTRKGLQGVPSIFH